MLNELSGLLAEIRSQMDVCTKCGMCQSVCPVYKATLKEQNVARGKIAVLEGLADNLFSGSSASLSILETCLLCGACEKGCSRQVKTTELFVKARLLIHQWKGLSPLKKIVLRHILVKPDRLDRLISLISYAGLIFRWLTEQSFFPVAFFEKLFNPSLQAGLNNVSGISQTSLRGTPPKKEGKRKKKALLFPGCLIPRLYPEIIEDCVAVADFFDVKLEIPEGAVCCGMPSAAMGDGVSFAELVEQNCKIISEVDYDYLVSACATCTFAIKKLWPKVCADASGEKSIGLQKIAANIIDFSPFMIDIAPENFFSGQKKDESETVVTLHDPCHLKNSLGITREPRLIMDKSDYQFVDMGIVDSCCGSGGTFGFTQPEISLAIGSKLMARIQDTNAGIVATSCPGCMLQIEGLAKRRGASLQVRHIATIAAQIIKNT